MVKKFLKEYNNAAPIGYVLRNNFSKYCLRIHNLKDKRYPENNNDRSEIILLFKQLIDGICTNEKILGFVSFYDDGINELENDWLKKLKLHFIGEYNINDKADEPYYVKTYAFNIDKKSIILESMIMDVAEEEFDGNLSIYCNVANQYSLAMAPYPGGIDIFIKDKEMLNLVRNKISFLNISIQKCP